MSSFIVRPETINRIVTYLYTSSSGGSLWASVYQDLLEEYGLANKDKYHILLTDSDKWPRDIAKRLLGLNISAMNQRYGENTGFKDVGEMKTKGTDFSYRFTHATQVQVYKSVQCLSYQCAEGNVPESQLYKFLEELQATLAREIIDGLPEYTKAAWD